MKISNILNVFKDNGIYGLFFSFRNIVNKFYNYIFLKRYNIYSDYSTYIYGVKYLQIDSVRIGKNCRIEMIPLYAQIRYNPLLVIGDGVILNDNVHIACAGYIEIGDNSLFASKVFITDHNHGEYNSLFSDIFSKSVSKRELFIKPVRIGKNVWLGEGVVVLPGAEIGDNTIVGANAVVHGKLPANCIAVGIPAKVIKSI